MTLELTTVSDDGAVFHDGDEVFVHDGLEPGREYELHGIAFRTLARPDGERLATFATVNDVHFGETECGVIEGLEIGPIFTAAPGEPPYPETMNSAAIEEIAAIAPDCVVAKGDLTTHGTTQEFEQFLAHYQTSFGEKLAYVRGNHDGYYGETFASDAPFTVDLPGATLAVLDTVIPRETTGQVSAAQLEWLDELGSRADRPVLVFGHHHVWNPDSRQRVETYFGIKPDDSERLVDVFARRPALVGYFAGHTHRNRARRFSATGAVPWVEVACTKDFPGAWAEYRVFDGGVLQVHHRISRPDALAWTERTRAMFGGMYPGYSFGDLTDRCFAVLPR
ncbi:MAG TPA: metallophosphoesterase [Acidimicrobiales bacterium]|nr:metallophosphoesterase [Acidimicrobiales bacterium]